jgi:[ribosomal protein S5]-alanine N-acetyltransferase
MIENRFPILTTERLNLRCISENDANSLTILRSDNEVNKYLDRPKTTTFYDTQLFIQKILRGVVEKTNYYWIITQKEDELLIGTICFWNFSEDKKTAEIGYELLPFFHGKGIMQEAIMSVIDFGFRNLGLTKILAFPKENNQNSIKLLEKVGFLEDVNYENGGDEDLKYYKVFVLTV